MLGELLGLPVVTLVIKLEVAADKKSATVTREIEGGQMVLDVPLPAVLSAQKGLNEPRYASLPGIMKAKKKPVDVKNAGGLGVSKGPMTVVKEMTLPPARQAGKIIAGDDAAAKAAALAKASPRRSEDHLRREGIEMPGTFIYAEVQKGEIKKGSFEVASKAKELGGEVAVCVIGKGAEALASAACKVRCGQDLCRRRAGV